MSRSQKTTIHVTPNVRDEVQTLKYQLGHSSANETVEYLLQEATKDD